MDKANIWNEMNTENTESAAENEASRLHAKRVPRRILGALLTGVSAGVVPRSGAPYIAIGRTEEIRALHSDLMRVAEGGSAMRFLIGRYGSGKSFLLQLLRSHALEEGFLTADADLSPERRLYGEGGVSTYRELSRNLSAKAAPDGGAWSVLLDRFCASAAEAVPQTVDESEYVPAVLQQVRRRLAPLTEEVGGYDYVAVLVRYCEGYLTDNEEITQACLRWLRGEYRTKTEARAAVGIRTLSVIDDGNWYVHLRLLGAFARLAGQRGVVVLLDECVNLYKIPNRISREANYEKILSMFNDTLQGTARGLMLVLGGTPRFLEDPRRGLFSYEALRSRLADARFTDGEENVLKNMMSPVIRLRRLSDNELFALCLRLRALHAQYYGTAEALSDDQTADFLREELSRTGAEEMVTPREIIRDFVTFLDLLYQNPHASFETLLRRSVSAPAGADPDGENALPAEGTPSEPQPLAQAPVRVRLEEIEL